MQDVRSLLAETVVQGCLYHAYLLPGVRVAVFHTARCVGSCVVCFRMHGLGVEWTQVLAGEANLETLLAGS